MGKSKKGGHNAPGKNLGSKPSYASAAIATPPTSTTTSAIKADPDLGYRIRVLIHDFLNVIKDPDASRRINSTTNVYYISAPYFNDTQSTIIRSAVVDFDPGRYPHSTAAGGLNDDGADDYELILRSQRGMTVVTSIRSLMSNFINKRRASGDTRPCGPHELAPMYASLFSIKLEELNEDTFLGRLRRSGV